MATFPSYHLTDNVYYAASTSNGDSAKEQDVVYDKPYS